MPLTITQTNQASDTARVAADLYKQQMQRISDKAEQIRRERTQQQQETPMPLRTRAESTDTEKRLTDLESAVADLTARLKKLESGDEPSDPEAKGWARAIAKVNARQSGPGVINA